MRVAVGWGMRWMVVLVFATFGCAQEPEPQPQTRPLNRPGAPIVSFVGSECGRLADDRVFCFDSMKFSTTLSGARTYSENGTPEGFSLKGPATCFAREDSVLRCYGSSVGGHLGGIVAKDDCSAATGLLGEGPREHWACAKDPAEMPGAPPVTSISGSCALSAGAVFCWGAGEDAAPTVITNLESGITKLASSSLDRRVCALREDGIVRCAERASGGAAALVPALEHVVDLSLGADSGCFLDDAGSAWCWDELDEGIGSSRDPWHPAKLETDLRFTKVDVGLGFVACGVTRERMVGCWGSVAGKKPRLLPGFVDVADIRTEGNSVLVLRKDGSVARVLAGETSSSPMEVAP